MVPPLDIPHILGKYFVKHYKSLVGKHFRIVVQLAPFVLFQFMDEEQRALWTALCQLAPLIFQTSIPNMESYLKNLEEKIDNFMYLITRMSAQWVNKPKFHMLLHLPLSIRRFGPASLFATEKFESFNGILRNASVHSNRHCPGRDLAISFANYECMRAIQSGGRLFNNLEQRAFYPSESVTQASKDKMILKSMGYNPQKAMTSAPFQFSYPSKKTLRKGVFVQVRSQIEDHRLKQVKSSTTRRIGRIEFLWHIQSNTSSAFVLTVTWFKILGISEFYQMRLIESTLVMRDVYANEIEATINVQHNCHDGQCTFKKKERTPSDVQEGDPGLSYETIHNNNNSYIINIASFHATGNHQHLSQMPHHQITASQWQAGIQIGIDKWNKNPNQAPKGKGKANTAIPSELQPVNHHSPMTGVESAPSHRSQGSSGQRSWGSQSVGSRMEHNQNSPPPRQSPSQNHTTINLNPNSQSRATSHARGHRNPQQNPGNLYPANPPQESRIYEHNSTPQHSLLHHMAPELHNPRYDVPVPSGVSPHHTWAGTPTLHRSQSNPRFIPPYPSPYYPTQPLPHNNPLMQHWPQQSRPNSWASIPNQYAHPQMNYALPDSNAYHPQGPSSYHYPRRLPSTPGPMTHPQTSGTNDPQGSSLPPPNHTLYQYNYPGDNVTIAGMHPEDPSGHHYSSHP
ncbi:uncharacterized protein PGTG_20749 [Puccinia graminis f. sp. tritici CRL 75-36-700-3]|uniref:Uncharacterized protein n=1 Tax=Puccinia graminis f. sp. tritici (strain CRL 75-36-700-3 / race SCCL) TaxID=418459 RepID=H6QP80_PUCGT|nr:uncharacterized protein PGTG_20749 [Puccinia graminis f. sp. tritici CRL 75-36-700-3]EHS63165.1 hypothetical protein PGTG_20749 [Puccinia graminis f. sp. tritici CRL 75-36-700-3]